MFKPKRTSFLVGALVFAGALLFAPPAQADYTLQVTLQETAGDHPTGPLTTPLSGPFATNGTLVFGPQNFGDFTNLLVSVTAFQSATASFLNNVTISGTTTSSTPITLHLFVDGEGFSLPVGNVNVQDSVSSSSPTGTFTSGTLIGALNSVPLPPISTGPASANTSPNFARTVPATYPATQDLTISGIMSDSVHPFNFTSNLTWTPVPPGLTMALLGLVMFIGLAWLRRRAVAVQ
jgi:hypothetical protein